MQTFVVRVFRSEHDASDEDRSLRGVVEDIRAASRTAFSDAAQLLAILGQSVAPSSAGADEGGAGATRTETDRPTSH